MSRMMLVAAVSVGVLCLGWAHAAPVLGPQYVIVLRVYFNDYAATSRFTTAEVQGFFDDTDTLWKNTSYGNINIDHQVTELYALPDNRSEYIDDGAGAGSTLCNDPAHPNFGLLGPPCDPCSTGDLSCGDKFNKIIEDAIANAPAGLDWSDTDVVLVLMAETSATEFHRGQGTSSRNLPMGPGGAMRNVGACIFSENPTESELQAWGRWCHEIGHAFQQDGGPAHPSNYNSEFELMDSNYPGQTGVFEKQELRAYPGWLLPASKYQIFTPSCAVGPDPCTGVGGGKASLWAMEYDVALRPNDQAIKAYITDNLYYLVSVRRRVLGDELNGGNQGGAPGTNGIPDEGVLIERVEEGAAQWVTLQAPPGGDRNDLWHVPDTFASVADDIRIHVDSRIDADNYSIYVTYGDGANQPDVGLNPWVSPPGNAYETTDIWFDSPVNGYDTYRRGLWDDGMGGMVPAGNGDDPAIGLVNRFYARVRNYGGAAAVNVVVHFERTDPPGVGIAGSNGFIQMGTVTSADFPALANIDPGDFADVYYEWTPDFTVPEDELEDGLFNFHTCVRVVLDAVADETVLGNQDGDREQENIDTFEVPPAPGAPDYDEEIVLRNDDTVKSKYFYLDYESDLPGGWGVDVNGGTLGVTLAAGERRKIPIRIVPGAAQPVGSRYSVKVTASSWLTLVNDLDPKDTHMEMSALGGVNVDVSVLQRPSIAGTAKWQGGRILVSGTITFPPNEAPRKPRVLIVGADDHRKFLPTTQRILDVDTSGNFSGLLYGGEDFSRVKEAVALFAGTDRLSAVATGYLEIKPETPPTPCAVGTVAAGSFLESHLPALREFRDDHLLPNAAGAAVVYLYYAVSPAVADFLGSHESARILAQWVLTPLVYAIEYPQISLAMALALTSAWVGRKRMAALRRGVRHCGISCPPCRAGR